jgi:tetratricopeptide (TPR) repeat protein
VLAWSQSSDSALAMEYVAKIEAHATAAEHADILGSVERLRALICQGLGKASEAEHHFERARDYYALTGDELEWARAIFGIGGVRRMMCDYEEAERYLELAQQSFEKFGDEALRLRCECLSVRGHVQMARGRFLEARALFLEALRLAVSDTEDMRRIIRADLAEAMRYFGEVEEARKIHQEQYDYYRARDLPHAHTAAVNLGVTLIMSRRFEEARALCRRTIVAMKRQNFIIYLGQAYNLSLCCAAALGEWDDWVRDWPLARAAFDAHLAADRDIAWTAEEAGRLAAEAGWAAQAREVFDLALRLWEALGDDDARRRVEGRLRTLH